MINLSGTFFDPISGFTIDVDFAPEPGADTLGSVAEDGGPFAVTAAALLANDTDADLDEGERLSITGVGDAVGGTVAFSAGDVVFIPAADFSGAAGFTYTVSDGNGGSAPGAVTFAVTPVNDAPVAVADAVAVAEDAATGNLWAALLGNDTDLDAGEALAISAVGTAGTLGTVAFDAAGQSLVYAADADAFDLLAPGATAADSFTYTVRDSGGLTSTATVAVTVTGGTNPAPVSLGSGADTLIGGSGADRLDGGDGADRLDGGSGDDILLGGGGNDILVGGSGADRLDGGAGADILTGDSGGDVFVFAAGTGRDTATDFGSGGDRVAVDGALFGSFAALRAAARQEGADVVIAQGSDALVLQGVALNSLGAGDFSFG